MGESGGARRTRHALIFVLSVSGRIVDVLHTNHHSSLMNVCRSRVVQDPCPGSALANPWATRALHDATGR